MTDCKKREEGNLVIIQGVLKMYPFFKIYNGMLTIQFVYSVK